MTEIKPPPKPLLARILLPLPIALLIYALLIALMVKAKKLIK